MLFDTETTGLQFSRDEIIEFAAVVVEPRNGVPTIVQEYDGKEMPFYHFDVYRIGDVEEMDEIGFEDYVYGEGVCLIEWAELIREILPDDFVSISIEKDLEKGFDYRKITLERGGVL